MNDTNEALKALLRLQRKLIGRGSGASCDTDEKIVKIRKEFKTIKDAIEQLRKERDEARREVCGWEHHWDKTSSEQYYADKRGWECFKEDGK